MKRYDNLMPQLLDFGQLLQAYQKARKANPRSEPGAKFTFHLESELLQLRSELATETWEPLPYRHFPIFDPKYRIISAAAFRDRVVHHALIQVLEPIYEGVFIFDSYATRKGKGTHAARKRAQHFVRRYSWFLKTDVEQYFASIDHEILITSLKRKIKDQALLGLLEKVIRHGGKQGKGLPIGNLTSQFLANVYLDPFDHFVKDTHGIKGYVRYMDDFVLWAEDKETLKKWKMEVEYFLQNNLQLSLKPSATFMNHRAHGLGFLGGRIFTDAIRIKKENLKRCLDRMKRRTFQFRQGEISKDHFLASQNGSWAYLAGFDSLDLRKTLLKHQQFMGMEP